MTQFMWFYRPMLRSRQLGSAQGCKNAAHALPEFQVWVIDACNCLR